MSYSTPKLHRKFCFQLPTFLLFVLQRYTPGDEVSSSTTLFSDDLPHLVMAVGALKRGLREKQIQNFNFALHPRAKERPFRAARHGIYSMWHQMWDSRWLLWHHNMQLKLRLIFILGNSEKPDLLHSKHNMSRIYNKASLGLFRISLDKPYSIFFLLSTHALPV